MSRHIRRSVIVVISGLFLAIAAVADPPGFKKVQITNTPADIEYPPRINNLGHVVWSSLIGGQKSKQEIYMYANGTTTRLTTDSTQDALPDINDDDTVTWSRFNGGNDSDGPTAEIVRRIDGNIESLTNDKSHDVAPRIGANGNIVWYKYTYDGCGKANRILEMFDGNQVTAFTDGSYSDQGPCINNAGCVVWTRYDFCDNPWTSAIWLLDSNGDTHQISDGFEPQVPSISETGVVAWADGDDLSTWDAGVVTLINDDGRNPIINSRGDIAFIRWNDGRRLWESWLYLGGDLRLIARSSQWELAYDMNERGDIVVQSVTKAQDKSEIFLYQRLPDADMNCDERIDFADIDGFVDAITDRASYESHNPSCDWWLADCNGDRHVDFNDIDPFVTCLINNGCP